MRFPYDTSMVNGKVSPGTPGKARHVPPAHAAPGKKVA